jgi:hypothetical protein
MENVGFFRDIVDIRATATVLIQGLSSDRPSSWTRIDLPMSTEESPKLAPRFNRLMAIDPSELSTFAERRLRDLGQEEIVANENRSLSDLLALKGATTTEKGDAVEVPYLLVGALANDGWTGNQFYVQSRHHYETVDIRDEQFHTGRRSRLAIWWDRAHHRYPALELESEADLR